MAGTKLSSSQSLTASSRINCHSFDRCNFERAHRMLPIAPDTLLQQRYRILSILEEGGSGRIYLATDRSRDDADCAIEEIALAAQPSTLAKAKEVFKQEITLLYQLQHPQLPHFWTTFEEQNRLFLVRDYIEGKTYGELLDERRALGTTFSQAEVWRFLLQILPVIGYIHSKGAIHRNISPEHIICRDGDRLPVPIDFGIVKELANTLQATPNGRQIATGQPGYAPVEQLHSGQVYPNSDLYSLAVTAIVLLTGKEPSALFEGDSAEPTHRERLNWEWRKWTPISDELATVLGRMLNPTASERYQSAIEVYRDLQPLSIPDSPVPAAEEPNPSLPSTLPTVAVAAKNSPNRLQSAITHLNSKSVWEKPQVFIPLGVLISLLAGFGSWFGVSQLLHRESPTVDPVASTPPKQIDFNNPTIPNDASSPSQTASDAIMPEMDRSIVKEGNVDPTNPVRYRISAVAGQNLDIQLVPSTSLSPSGDRSSILTDPSSATTPGSIDSIGSNPTQSPNPTKSSKPTNPPISVPTTSPSATQVLMSVMSPTGTPVDSQADRVVGWRGQIPTTGEYTVELRPIKGLSGGTFPYKLSVTQVAVTPSPSPSVETTPATGVTPPVSVPAPVGDNGLDPIPSKPLSPAPSNNSVPNGSAAPIPIVVPTMTPTPTPSERPTRNRRRSRTETQPSPTIRQRDREESTPTPRRRTRVEPSEEPTPTPRRRRRSQQNDSESQPTRSPSPSPDTGNNAPNSTPTPEPSVGIPVPPAKNATPPANSGAIDPD
jgi:serine/threonine protein kinase